MSRYNSNNGWIVLAGIVAVIAWFIMQNDYKSTDLEKQVSLLVDQVGESIAATYAFIADQMNPAVHADPAVCHGNECFEADITLDSSFTAADEAIAANQGINPDYRSAYDPLPFSWGNPANSAGATTHAQLTP